MTASCHSAARQRFSTLLQLELKKLLVGLESLGIQAKVENNTMAFKKLELSLSSVHHVIRELMLKRLNEGATLLALSYGIYAGVMHMAVRFTSP